VSEEVAVETSKRAPAQTAPAQDPAQVQAVEETVEEIRFYLKHSMVEQACTALVKLEKLKPGAAMLKAMRAEIETASTQASATAEAVEEISVEEVDAAPAEVEAPPAKVKAGALKEFVANLDSSLGEEFRPKTTAREIPAPEPAMAESAVASATPAGVLGDFVSDLEASLGEGFLPQAQVPEEDLAPEPTPRPASKKANKSMAASAHASRPASPTVTAPSAAVSTAAAAVAPALHPTAASPTFTYQPTKMRPLAAEATAPVPMAEASAGVDLADMFGELKHELEEDTATAEEDPETHYNLGVAFREMGLLDEAIGELQKVCQAVDRGHTFPQLMQTYTWLAQCFLDKGVPEAAIRWYERALKLAGIDQETRTALHYELASAYESAGNKPEALSHFMEVYGSNIDYRDVAERIKALKS
jgi:tetratricopeptide (TPR) repeat protein